MKPTIIISLLTKNYEENKERFFRIKRLNSIKKTGKIVYSVLSKPNRNIKCTTLLDSSGAEVHDSRDIANMFCDHFPTEVDKLFMPEPELESFAPTQASVEQASINLLFFLSPKYRYKPCNINSIPIFTYKILSTIISSVIFFFFFFFCDIYNLSIIGRVFSCHIKNYKDYTITQRKKWQTISISSVI